MGIDAHPTADGALRLVIDEDLSIYHAAEIKDRLIKELQTNPILELDLSHVGEVDTAGFQLLVLAKMESQRHGGALRLVAHSDSIREVIEFFNMAAFFGDPLVIPAANPA